MGWLRVDDRVLQLAMGLVYKIHYTTLIPKYLSKYFTNIKDVHNYNTRGSATDHFQPRVKTNKGSNSFFLLCHQNVESLTKGHKLKECGSLASFKIALKTHL